VNRGGFVSAKYLSFWCTAAGCQGQVSTENLESLFQPSLPSFAGPVAATAAFLVTRAAGGLFSAAAALLLSQDRAFESRRAPTATTLAQAALFGHGQEISLGTAYKSPPRPMATFGSPQLPQPLNPRLSRRPPLGWESSVCNWSTRSGISGIQPADSQSEARIQTRQVRM
jgi:hypothetical protein